MKEMIIATKNPGKAKEFKTFFSAFQIEAISLAELDRKVDDIEETGTTFEENAAIKAETIAGMIQRPVLADDSGLAIDALDGRPGVYSARYAGEPKDDQANIDKVLQELKGVEASDRTARFVCVLAIAVPGETTIFKKGYCEGEIAYSQIGENGFGYDPIFVPTGYNKTMAQLSPIEKNRISHRKNAIVQLEDWVKNATK
ncbi:XTP/dITP diphosphatase [Lentibacillus cibarius]|uniref:dITP/XTP pyrophosphatase n=1 Tax=Lentibacillus cibarius TaxID=2583219 RepID=A0A5S3QGS7_9BACI|nr:XTP/dITP diphosphatase [Lentibacillus cibarius]TMN21102.1 XTP/dITP diphosphatase [Lentibacillus cibarius]